MTGRLPTQRSARGNRCALTVIGMALVVSGVAALAAPPHAAVLPAGDGRLGGWWWVVGAGAALVALACLRWLIVQLRTDGFAGFALEPDERRGGTHLPSRVLAAAVETELRALPGVSSARATLAGWATEPELRLTVGLEAGGDVGGLRRLLVEDVVAHARDALGVDSLPVHLTLVLVTPRARPGETVLP